MNYKQTQCLIPLFLCCIGLMTLPAYGSPNQLTALPTKQQQDEAVLPVEQIVKEIRQEIGAVGRLELELLITSYQEALDLKQETCSALRNAGKQSVSEFVKEFSDEQILQIWERCLFTEAPINGIRINGRECLAEGVGESLQTTIPEVTISMFASQAHIAVEVDSVTTGGSLDEEILLNIDDSPFWKNNSGLTEEQLNQYREYKRAKLQDRVASLMLASLTISLKLSDEQKEESKTWIQESIDGKLGDGEIYLVAKKALQALEQPPATYSEEQIEVLKMLQAGLR